MNNEKPRFLAHCEAAELRVRTEKVTEGKKVKVSGAKEGKPKENELFDWSSSSCDLLINKNTNTQQQNTEFWLAASAFKLHCHINTIFSQLHVQVTVHTCIRLSTYMSTWN